MRRVVPGWIQPFLSWSRPVRAISTTTFQEVVRDKVFYNLLALGVAFVFISLLASQLAVRSEGRILIDLGLVGLSVSLGMIAVFMGSSLISRELDRRTFHIALSRPISRLQFVFGKYLGLAWVILLNSVVVSILLVGVFALLAREGGGGEGAGSVLFGHPLLGSTFVAGLVLETLQALTLLGFSILYSSFTTTSLSVVMTLGTFLIGANLSQLRWLAVQEGVRSTPMEGFLLGLAKVLPNFELFDVDSWVSYALELPSRTVLVALLYSFALIGGALFAASISIQGRENA
jgi:Cu-processing system permease protein